jgi:DNA-binding transcriptional ArsR family regulator
MEDLFAALANPLRTAILRVLLHSPGMKHNEILASLDMSRGQAGTLTKAIETLEIAGLVRRDGAAYGPVDPNGIARLLLAGAELQVAAKTQLAEQAQKAIPSAEKAAAELRRELED